MSNRNALIWQNQSERRVLNELELADGWGMSHLTLQRWRVMGLGPKFLKLGGKVSYRIEDVEEYEQHSLRISTSQSAHAAGVA